MPKRRFSLVADDLQAEPHNLLEAYETVKDCVSLIDLRNIRVLGVLGSRDFMRKIAGGLALQIAALHCYTDVKLAFILRPGEDKFYNWASSLPHVRWQENKIRLMSADDSQKQNVLFYLNGVLRSRAEAQADSRTAAKASLPHIVVFCTDPELINRENISRYLSQEYGCGLTFILLYERVDRLPNECNHIIQSDENFNGFYRLDQSRDETNTVCFDEYDSKMIERLSRKISGYIVTELSTGEIPSSVSFLELYGIKSLDEWGIDKRWRENRAYESLRALIGIGTGGKPLYLDIHEKQHGPHGRV